MSYTVNDITINHHIVNCQFQTDDCQIVNLFRQIIMSEITTLAIDSVYFQTNTSIISEEYLAHRLGLIPLKSQDLDLELDHDLKNIILEINVHATNEVHYVTTDDIKSNGKVVPVHNNFLICKLLRGQSLHLKAFVKYGTGKEHVKWSPVSCVTFKQQSNGYLINMETHGNIDPQIMIKQALTLMST